VRLTKTGTGRGQVVGSARIDFHAQQDRAVRSGAVTWDGDAVFAPLLTGIAFDQYFPNLRFVPRGDDAPLIGKDAQRATLNDFEEWVAAARDRINAGEPVPLFTTLPLAPPAPGEHITESAEFVVRFNDAKERLWGETAYATKQGGEQLFQVVHELFWNWCAEQGRDANRAMLDALEAQFAYYDAHRIPSDFLMREIGRAPYAAWRAP
jgi:hypothetical protein